MRVSVFGNRHSKRWKTGRDSTDLEPEEESSAVVAATGVGRYH